MTKITATKAPYRKPVLTEHGTIRGMTKTANFGQSVNDSDGPGTYTS
ncbi:hypothetical protein TPR58_22060 [Sphingomonas sp. HF-S3]|jgi:hypothetical protein|uniref:Lasso RiPP family leader peptide-containing protein n=1 Tax=Sphingomonas rustica TaxID=3103142 RepID=A0ABV0BEA4_9SPHN